MKWRRNSGDLWNEIVFSVTKGHFVEIWFVRSVSLQVQRMLSGGLFYPLTDYGPRFYSWWMNWVDIL